MSQSFHLNLTVSLSPAWNHSLNQCFQFLLPLPNSFPFIALRPTKVTISCYLFTAAVGVVVDGYDVRLGYRRSLLAVVAVVVDGFVLGLTVTLALALGVSGCVGRGGADLIHGFLFDGLADDVDEGAVDELVTVDDVVGRDGLERKGGKRDGVLLNPQSALHGAQEDAVGEVFDDLLLGFVVFEDIRFSVHPKHLVEYLIEGQ